jgi:hypothetical protein
LDLIGAAQIEVFADDLLKENASVDRLVQVRENSA